jgi:ketosteroid isomerase-like protein
MSQSEIENIRARYDAVNRGDRSALFRDVQPGFALQTPDRVPGAGTYFGAEEATRFMADFWEPFEEVIVEPQEFFESDNRIVALLRVRLRHKGSSAFVDLRVGTLWTMRDGKPLRVEMYPEPEKALEAAGLERSIHERPGTRR